MARSCLFLSWAVLELPGRLASAEPPSDGPLPPEPAVPTPAPVLDPPPPVPSYYWPVKSGNVRFDGSTPHVGPRDLSKTTRVFTFQGLLHRHQAMPLATPVIDDELSVYVQDNAGWLVKFASSGALKWVFDIGGSSPTTISIYNGTVLCSADPGVLVAVSMETGKELWRQRIFATWPGDISSFAVYQGYAYVAGAVPEVPGMGLEVASVSIALGEARWRYHAQGALYNWMPSILEELGLLVFSDVNGNVYGLHLENGEEAWKNKRFQSHPNVFTTASGSLGGNGVFYAAYNLVSGWDYRPAVGMLHAVNATDGSTLWAKNFPVGMQASPGIGRLHRSSSSSRSGGSSGGSGLSVVVGVGDNTGIVPALLLERWVPDAAKFALNALSIALGDWSRFLWWIRPWEGQRVEVHALDAETGQEQWRFKTPTWWRPTCAGDEERYHSWMKGVRHRGRSICTCDAWSSPVIDGDGTAYIGNGYGVLYALRDEDGDGAVAGPGEVSSLDMGAAILVPPSIAPDMLAVTTCEEVAVYRF